MIQQINRRINLTEEQEGYINSLRPFTPETWNSQTNDMQLLKRSIRSQLDTIQTNKCAYCVLELKETSEDEIEHIAPKGRLRNNNPLYPEFTFEKENLVLACHRCNCSRKKTFNTIEVYNQSYHLCTFRIVHPYYDDPTLHFSWVENLTEIIIIGLTPKGRESIRLFGLDTEQQSTARAKLRNYERIIGLSDENRMLIERILDFKN